MTDGHFSGNHVQGLAYALGAPLATARIRQRCADFKVWEELSFSPCGSGEHVFLEVQKTNLNTEDVAQLLAKKVGIKPVDVGYAGLKDKNAVTCQWFSLNLTGKSQPDWDQCNSDNLIIKKHLKHDRKLKTGAIAKNRFQIILDDLVTDKEWLLERIATIQLLGVPNYFGEQRFGRGERNLTKARDMLQGKKVKSRHLRGVYFSAIRSFLFNQVLSHRVSSGTWNSGLDGDAMVLDGSRGYFVAERIDAEIEQRIQSFDIHPSGPLPGKDSCVGAVAAAMERNVLEPYSDLCLGLAQSGLKGQRRSLRLPVHDLKFSWLDVRRVQLDFSLPSGAYATSVLRELVQTTI